MSRRPLEPLEKLRVIFGLAKALQQQLHRFYRFLARESATEQVDRRHRVRIKQLLFFSSARLRDIDRREDSSLCEFAVKDKFQVASALELLKDHFVHLAAGIDQRGGNDRERAAFFSLSGRTEELAREFERARVHAASHRAPATAGLTIGSASQSRYRI